MNDRDHGNERLNDRRDSVLAATCAGFLIAFQVAGKAVRDALFLSTHSISELPAMIVVAALGSILTMIIAVRLMRRSGPAVVVPRAFLVSGLVLIAVATAGAVIGARAEMVSAVVVYLHFTASGAILSSGFWSVMNERFDPRTARKLIGRIALGGTLGGLLGGLAAWRFAAIAPISALLPFLAGMHLICALTLFRMGRALPKIDTEERSDRSFTRSLSTFARVPYLRNLAALVFTSTVAAICLDFVFKARATETVHSTTELLRFFALFYTGVSLATFLLQAGLGKRMLERAGLANTVATMPAGVAVGAAASFLIPGLASAAVARGAEGTLRNSLFRSGYEPLYVPLPTMQKRESKQIIDVGFERLGDVFGGGMIALIVLIAPSLALRILALAAMVLGILGVWITRRLHAGWLSALEGSLKSHAIELDVEEHDSATRTVIFQTLQSLNLAEAVDSPRESSPAPSVQPTQGGELIVLMSADAASIRHLLVRTPSLPDDWISPVIALLARDDLAGVAGQSLRTVASRRAGQLLDRLLDPEQDFVVRRRLPAILVDGSSQRVVDGLLQGLADLRFEVRYQCARALEAVRGRNQALDFDQNLVFEAVLREIQVSAHVWKGHRLLDQAEADRASMFDDELLRSRPQLGLEHVFTLLAIVMSAQPLAIAYRGLFTDDKALRGTALEYLESVLPDQIRGHLWPLLEADVRSAPQPAASEAALQRLLQSQASIRINLEELGREQS